MNAPKKYNVGGKYYSEWDFSFNYKKEKPIINKEDIVSLKIDLGLLSVDDFIVKHCIQENKTPQK